LRSPRAKVESIEHSEFKVRHDVKNLAVSDGGPRAWFGMEREESGSYLRAAGVVV
jgi:hypothetical protein